MVDTLLLSIPPEISERAYQIAQTTQRSVEDILLEHLKTLIPPSPVLSDDVQTEIDALHHLSDDALWTIAREQLPNDSQTRAQELLTKNNRAVLTPSERDELAEWVERSDRLILRKAEAAAILRARGHHFAQQDFKAQHK